MTPTVELYLRLSLYTIIFILVLLLVPLGAMTPIGWAVAAAALATLILVVRFRSGWISRFTSRTRRFTWMGTGRVVLEYDPRIRQSVDPVTVLRLATTALDSLEATFARYRQAVGHRLRVPGPVRYPVRVYLLPSLDAVQEILPAGAFAIRGMNAVVVPLTGLPLEQVLRHELTHLLAFHIRCQLVPPLLREGLAVWLEDPAGRQRLNDEVARRIAARQVAIRPLLDPKEFRDPRYSARNYALAGSFTGFLLRRFGPGPYFRLYNALHDGRDFESKFAATIGLSLAEAETEWQDRVVREATPPGLRTAIAPR